MRKLLVGLIIATTSLAFHRSVSHGAAIAYDGFDYATGSSLGDKNGGSGKWTSAWVQPSGQTAPSIASGLTYTDLATGKALDTNGGSAQDNGSSALVAVRAWDSTGLTSDGSTIWFSTLFNSSTTASSDVRVYFTGASASDFTNVGAGLFAASGGPTVAARINASTSSTLSYTRGETTLVVGRITFSDTAGQDEVRVWVNPSFTSVPSDASGVAVLGTINASNYDRLSFRQGSPWQGFVDELRMGETYFDVVPEPASLAIVGVVGIGLLRRHRRVLTQ